MKNPARLLIFLLVALDIVLFVDILLHGKIIAILQPRGIIALQERDLMITAILLMLIVVIPVFMLAFFVAWKYKANNTNATYTPEWNHHTKAQPGKKMTVLGSSDLCVSLLKLGLLDELRIMVNPVVLGKGTRLFQELDQKCNLTLTKSRTFKNGNVLLYYQVEK